MSVVVIRKNNTYAVTEVFQWDTNRLLEIYGVNFSTLPEIHFAKASMSKAIVKQATRDENGIVSVEIPNSLLETASPIKVYVCGYDGEEFVSRYSFTIEVKARPKPEDYFAEDDEKIYSYNALENLVNNTIVNVNARGVSLHDSILAEVDARCNNAISEMRDIVNNATIANADTLDGYDAEDFVFSDKSGKTVFNPDGSITTNYNDGSSETIVFNSDGSITTTRNTLELGVKTKTTRFNSDGSITVTVG